MESTNTEPVKRGRPKKAIDEEVMVLSPRVDESQTVMQSLLDKVTELERKDNENQAKLKMLYDVADKGRVFNYENTKAEKQAFKVKLSIFGDGIIVGWRTVRDDLVKHPTTGLTVGENQEYELLLLDNEGKTKKVT